MNQQPKMRSEVVELMNCMHEVDLSLANEQVAENVLLLMGETKAGKTTLMYYLLKKKLVLEKNELGITVMKAEAQFQNYVIGDNYTSTTIYPNFPLEGDEGCQIIDLPGFSDTRPFYRLLNIYIILKTIRKIKNVHISFVVPYESLEGEGLLTALENNCLLLKEEFLIAQKCSSFILTKIEEKQCDRDTFDEQMEYLKEEYSEEAIGPIVTNFDNINTYFFCREDPQEEEGGQLKDQIVSENNFFAINETPSNLLSPRYAQVIVGQGNLEEFISYTIDITKQIWQYLPILIELLTSLIQFHHFRLLVQCDKLQENKLEQIKNKVFEHLKVLKIRNICKIDPNLNELTDKNKENEIVTLIKKIIPKTTNPEEETNFLGELDHLKVISEHFLKQESAINKQLRSIVSFTLSNSLNILKVIFQVKEELIQNQLKAIENSPEFDRACRSFKEFFMGEDFIRKVASLPEAQQMLESDEEFRQIVTQHVPDLMGQTQQVKIIHERYYDKIRNKKWQNSFLETTKVANEDAKNKAKFLSIKNLVPKLQSQIGSLLKKLDEMEGNQQNLELLIKSIKQFDSKGSKISVEEEILKEKLWRKGMEMLTKLRMFEEAILLAMGIPNQIKITTLIDYGIQFREISVGFIESCLIPFYAKIEFNFAIIEKLFGYLSLHSLQIKEVVRVERLYVETIRGMRKTIKQTEGESQFEVKRFNIDYVSYFTSKEGLKDLKVRAKQSAVTLAGSRLGGNVSKKQLFSLDMTDDK